MLRGQNDTEVQSSSPVAVVAAGIALGLYLQSAHYSRAQAFKT